MAKEDAAEPKVELQIKSYDEIQELIAGHKGQVVVMDAWSTSCEPCLKAFPGLVALHKKLGAEGVACISLSFDFEGLGKPEERREDVLAFLKEQGATFENLLSSDDSDTLYTKFKLPSIPAVFVYDQTGKLAKRFDDTDRDQPHFTYDDVEKLVKSLLEKDS